MIQTGVCGVGSLSNARRRVSFFGRDTADRNGVGKPATGKRLSPVERLSPVASRVSAADRSGPSGTRQPNERTAGLHELPRPQAIGRGAYRLQQILLAPMCNTLSVLRCWLLRCCARLFPRRTARSIRSVSDPESPLPAIPGQL